MTSKRPKVATGKLTKIQPGAPGPLELSITIDLELRELLHTAIGQCVTTWVQIESELLSVLLRVLASKRWPSVAALFYSAVAFDQKLRMVDAASRHALAEDALKRWEKLAERCRKQAGYRNRIVHLCELWRSPMFTDEELESNETIHFTPYIAPDRLNVDAHDRGPPEYDAKDLLDRGEVFAKLRADLREFADWLKESPDDEAPTHPPTSKTP